MCDTTKDCTLPNMKIFGASCCPRCFGWFWTEEDEEKYWLNKHHDKAYIKQRLKEYKLKEKETRERQEKEDKIKQEKLKKGYVYLENGQLYREKDILEGSTGLNGTLWNSGYRPDDEHRLTWHRKRVDEE